MLTFFVAAVTLTLCSYSSPGRRPRPRLACALVEEYKTNHRAAKTLLAKGKQQLKEGRQDARGEKGEPGSDPGDCLQGKSEHDKASQEARASGNPASFVILFIAANNQFQFPSPRTMFYRRRDATRSRHTKTNEEGARIKSNACIVNA